VVPHRDLDVTLPEDPAARERALAFGEAAAHGIEGHAKALEPVEIEFNTEQSSLRSFLSGVLPAFLGSLVPDQASRLQYCRYAGVSSRVNAVSIRSKQVPSWTSAPTTARSPIRPRRC
jgi:hypothetical protein